MRGFPDPDQDRGKDSAIIGGPEPQKIHRKKADDHLAGDEGGRGGSLHAAVRASPVSKKGEGLLTVSGREGEAPCSASLQKAETQPGEHFAF